MKTPICDCGSDQLRYLGITDVEGNTIIEEFRCEECGSAVERRTVVDGHDLDDDYDTWDSRRDSLLPQP